MYLIILLAVGIAVVGFYRGWFRLSTNNTDQKPSATITMDTTRIREDEDKAKEMVQDFGHNSAQTIGDRTENVR